MSDIKNNHPHVYLVKNCIASYPKGLTNTEVCTHTRIKKDRVNKLLTICKNQEYIYRVGLVWVGSEHRAEAVKAWEIRKKEHKKIRNRERHLMYPRRNNNLVTPQEKTFVLKEPTIDQLPKRFLVTAPNSVFQLAEFMGLRLV